MERIVTRIAPSPTGRMHIGTVRTALFNYLFAHQYQGTFFVRIEDTDAERNRPEWTQAILDDFTWCGLEPDRVYIQSEHLGRHQELLQKLIEEGKAYVSKEEAKDKSGRVVAVVRLKNPGKQVTFNDLIRGDISFDTTELGDFVIARSLTEPLYHFAVVVDDADAGVTHIIRAEDILSSTPRQILIQEALGFKRPHYAHLPLILAADRSKLSKRKHVVSIEEYRERGYIPEGIINYLALLGWNPGTEQESFSLSELVELFSIDQLQKSGAVFDEVKMCWFNREHLRRLSPDEYRNRIVAFVGETGGGIPEYLSAIIGLLQERAETLGEAAALLKSGEFAFMEDSVSIDPGLLVKGAKAEAKEVIGHLQSLKNLLSGISDMEWDAERVKRESMGLAEEKGKAAVLWPLRVALSGREKSPDPFTIAELVGKQKTLQRIGEAIEVLGKDTDDAF